jgi:hypothetical protein
MVNKYIDLAKEKKILKNIKINKSKSRQIKTIITSIVILSGVQGIQPSKVLSFDIIPIEAVSTPTTSLQSLGLGNYLETFRVEVSNEPELNPMTKLVGFTVSFTPFGIPPSPPAPSISVTGTPSGWQVSETGQIPNYFCGGGPPFGKPYCVTISIPTLTFQAITPNAGIMAGVSLDGFGVSYNTGCGLYCRSLEKSVIAVSSVPEPVTILGSAIALGFGINLKRKYSKTDSHKT